MLALLLLAALPNGREAIGAYQGWAAFRDRVPARCYAIEAPVERGRRGAFASIARWPRHGLRGMVHIRLSRPRDPAAALTLSVGERRFALVGTGADAWAPDTATDRAAIAAMREGRAMSVEWTSGGRPVADSYALAGAATAIDAAMLACASPVTATTPRRPMRGM